MAYYSNQGTVIHSAAAGYGKLQAYKDGSLGKFGKLQAYKDGSLGRTGRLQAYKDGSLGKARAGYGPMQAYQEGSLGYPLFIESDGQLREMEEPVTIHHMSQPPGHAECGSCGLGATAGSLPVLDLTDPAAMQELKSAIVLAPWVLATVNEQGIDMADKIEVDIKNPRWTDLSKQLVETWMAGFGPFMWSVLNPGKPEDPAVLAELAQTVKEGFGPNLVPNVQGVSAIYAVVEFMDEGQKKVGAPPYSDSLSILTQYVQAVRANDNQGLVEAPGGGVQQADMLAVGVGVAALVAVGYLLFGKKGRK